MYLAFERQSFLKKLIEHYCIIKAMVVPKYPHMSSHALDTKTALYKDFVPQANAFRHQVKDGLLTTEEVNAKRELVFSLC